MKQFDRGHAGLRVVRTVGRAAAGLSLAGALAGAITATGAAAQPPGPPPGGQPRSGGAGGPGRMQAMLFEGITLDAAQQVKVDSIGGAYRERMMRQREAATAAPPDSAAMAARRTTMQELRGALRAELRPDQQKTFDTNVQRMEARMRQGGGPGRPPGGAR